MLFALHDQAYQRSNTCALMLTMMVNYALKLIKKQELNTFYVLGSEPLWYPFGVRSIKWVADSINPDEEGQWGQVDPKPISVSLKRS